MKKFYAKSHSMQNHIGPGPPAYIEIVTSCTHLFFMHIPIGTHHISLILLALSPSVMPLLLFHVVAYKEYFTSLTLHLS